METNKKLNLNAIMKSHQDKKEALNSNKTEEVQVETKATETAPVKKLNISALKNDAPKTETKKEEIKTEEKIETPKISEIKKEEVKTEEIKKEIKVEAKKAEEIKEKDLTEEKAMQAEELVDNSLAGIKNPEIKKDEKAKVEIKTEAKKSEEKTKKEAKTEKVENSKKEEKEDENGEIFKNYDGGFTNNKTKVIDNIKKIKNLPKTRPRLVFSMIFMTLAVIGGLFFMNPEKYGIDGYKASIIDSYNGLTGNIEKPWELELKRIEGFEFPIEKKEAENGNIIYRYKETIYNTIEELNRVIQMEIDTKKREIYIQIKKEAETKVKNIIIEKFGK